MFENRSFTQKYIIAFLIIALLAILAYLNLSYLISEQYKDAKKVNISGQQRMLSQKILLHSIEFDEEKLKISIDDMRKNHVFLHSNKVEYFHDSDENILDKKVNHYLNHASQYLATKNHVDLEYLKNNAEYILNYLDKIVNLYQIESENKVQYLKNIEFIFLVLIFIVLIVEIVFIFMPANKKIIDYEKQLKNENRKLSLEIANRSQEIIEKYIISSKTDLQGCITYISKAFENISGYSAEELIGKHHRFIRHPDMNEEIFKDMWETIECEKTWHGEIQNRKKDGTAYWVEIIIEPIFENGLAVGYSSIGQNITSKKDLDALNKSLNAKIALAVKELDDKNRFMLQQSRLAQMGEMISMIAHQWRQPLSSISSVINNLVMKIHLQKYEEKYFLEKFESVISFTEHLSSTVDDFKNFFEPTSGKKETSLKEIIDNSLAIISGSLNDNKIDLVIKIESQRVYFTYESELKQVLINLINNAKDILIENEVTLPQIIIEVINIEGSEVLRISDNGGGVAPDIIDKIFDPYFSTKKSKNGTGLGLYMSKLIIEDHCNGKLSIHNSENGAVFDITFTK